MFVYGISTSILNSKKDTIYDAIKFAGEHGFKRVEIVCESPEIIPGFITINEINRIKDLAFSFNVEIQLHAPFYSINLSSFDDEFLRFSIRMISDTIKLGYLLEVDRITIHVGLCFLPCQLNREKAMKRAAESFSALMKEAENSGIKLAIENRGGKLDIGRIDELLLLLDLLNYPESIGFTFDVVQANVVGDPIEQFKKIGKYVINSHIRDAPKGKEGLLAVGEGEIDFHALLKEFINVGFYGPLILEVSSRERAIISRAALDEIFEDIQNN